MRRAMGSVLHGRILNIAGRHYRVLTDPQRGPVLRASTEQFGPPYCADDHSVEPESRGKTEIASTSSSSGGAEELASSLEVDNAVRIFSE